MSRRVFAWIAVAVALGGGVVVASNAWRFSDELRDELLAPPRLDAGDVVEVIALDDGGVVLALTDASLVSGTWGLSSPASYGRISTVIDSSASTITRSYVAESGSLVPGPATLDQLAFRGGPADVFGDVFEPVSVPTDLGPAPAWFIEGNRGRWVVYAHGAGGLEDSYRALRAVIRAGYSALVITYRNQPGAPATPDGLVTWGFDEWMDLEAGVEFALSSGADDIIVMGSGIGGSAALVLLDETAHIRSINGIILDSPILDLAAVEEARDPSAGLAGSLGRALASWRFGVEWSRLDHASRASGLRRPVLVLQGAEDRLTPLATAETFAATGGDTVDLRVFEGAGHGQSWNVAPLRYETLVEEFLAEHAPLPE